MAAAAMIHLHRYPNCNNPHTHTMEGAHLGISFSPLDRPKVFFLTETPNHRQEVFSRRQVLRVK